MSLQFQLIVGASFLTVVYVLVTLRRRQVKAGWERLIAETSSLERAVIEDVRLSYVIDNGGKLVVSIFNRGDIHLFNDFIIVFRRQDVFFLFYFEPLVLCRQLAPSHKTLQVFKQHRVEQFKIEALIKGEIEITWTDSMYKGGKTSLTLKNLSQEQVKQLSVLRTWVQ